MVSLKSKFIKLFLPLFLLGNINGSEIISKFENHLQNKKIEIFHKFDINNLKIFYLLNHEKFNSENFDGSKNLGTLGLSWSFCDIFFENQQGKTRENYNTNFKSIEEGGNYYREVNEYFSSIQKNTITNNNVGGCFRFEGKNLRNSFQFSISNNSSNIYDISYSENKELYNETKTENGVEIITNQNTITNTNVSSYFEINNLLALLAIGAGGKIEEFGEHNIDFALVNGVYENNENIDQLINNKINTEGYVIIKTENQIDTIPFSYNQSEINKIKNEIKERDYFLNPILTLTSKFQNFSSKIGLEKLITKNNKMSEDWIFDSDFIIYWKKILTQLSLIFNNNISHKIGGNLKLTYNNNNKTQEMNWDKLNIEMDDIYNIKFIKQYLPSQIKNYLINLKEFNLFEKIYGIGFGLNYLYDKNLKTKDIFNIVNKNIYGIEGYYNNEKFGIDLGIGNVYGYLKARYKNLGICINYEKFDYGDYRDEIIKGIIYIK